MSGSHRSIDNMPTWLSKILLNKREWPLYKTDDDLKSAASDYLPEHSSGDGWRS